MSEDGVSPFIGDMAFVYTPPGMGPQLAPVYVCPEIAVSPVSIFPPALEYVNGSNRIEDLEG